MKRNKKLELLISFSDKKISALILETNSKKQISILGHSSAETPGLYYGTIQNIEQTYNTLAKIITELKKICDIKQEDINNMAIKVVISSKIGGRQYSQGILNFIENEIQEQDINRVVNLAIYNANIQPNHQVLNITIDSFKVDGYEIIQNPLNMISQKLEVNLSVQLIGKPHFANLIRIFKKLDLSVDLIAFDEDIILNSILTEEEKSYGSIIYKIQEDDSKLVFTKRGLTVKETVISYGSSFIIEQISREFKLSFSHAKLIFKNLNNFIPESKEAGYFEVEVSSNKIITIELEKLADVITSSFIFIIEEAKKALEESSNKNWYSNGIIFLNTFDIQGVDDIFESIFENEIKSIKAPNSIFQKNETDIFNLELIENDLTLLGLIKTDSSDAGMIFNHELMKVNTDLELDEDLDTSDISLSNINYSKQVEKNEKQVSEIFEKTLKTSSPKEGFFKKTLKQIQKYW